MRNACDAMRLLIIVALALSPLVAVAGCLTYEREAIFTGVVRLTTAPAPPNNASIAAGDRAERVPKIALRPWWAPCRVV